MEHVINIWTKTMYGNADLSDATKKPHQLKGQIQITKKQLLERFNVMQRNSTIFKNGFEVTACLHFQWILCALT